MKSKLNCPFCGSKKVNKTEFYQRTGLELEKTLNLNGELKIILKLGELAVEGHKQNGQSTMDKERLFQLLKEEHQRIDERQKELEENRRNIAKEQKETLSDIADQRKELENKQKEITSQYTQLNKLKEEVIKEEAVQLPKEIIKQFKELQLVAQASNTEVKELLQKMIHNVKVKGNLQEAQLTRRLKTLNTGDTIKPLGGANQEDIIITVKESDKELGSIKIDSKNIKKWDSKYIEQMKRYLKENNVDFGLIATTAMPKDAAGSDFYWEGKNILIVDQNFTEAVYLICRYLLIKNAEYATEYNTKAASLKENEHKLQAIKVVLEKASFKEYFKSIIEEITKDNKHIDELEVYFNRKVSSFRTCNAKITKQVNAALDNDKELQKVLVKK